VVRSSRVVLRQFVGHLQVRGVGSSGHHNAGRSAPESPPSIPEPLGHKRPSATSQEVPKLSTSKAPLSLPISNWQHHLPPSSAGRAQRRGLLTPSPLLLCCERLSFSLPARLTNIADSLDLSVASRCASSEFHTTKTHPIPLSRACSPPPNAVRPRCSICPARRPLILLLRSSSPSCSRLRDSILSGLVGPRPRPHRWTPHITSAIAYDQIDRLAPRRYGVRTSSCIVVAAALCTPATSACHPHLAPRIAPDETKPEAMVEGIQASAKGPGSTW
jgi:hypothetical protein